MPKLSKKSFSDVVSQSCDALNRSLVKQSSPTKRKTSRKGILGVPIAPKRNRLLFIVKKNGLRETEILSSSSDDDDDSLDLNYQPDDSGKVKPRQSKSERSNKAKKLKTAESNENQANWSDGLPYEILFNIFYHVSLSSRGNIIELNRMRCVCKYWSTVANDARLWHTLDMSTLLPHAYLTKSNMMSSSTKINKQMVAKFEQHVTKLISYSLDNANSNKFAFITRLNLSNLFYMTCDVLELILKSCNPDQLTELDLANCVKVHSSEKDLAVETVLATHCPKLSSLNLSHTEKALNPIPAKHLFEVLAQTLIKFNLSQNVISTNLLKTITSECRKLELLDISNSKFIGTLDLDTLSGHCNNLKCLRLLKSYPKIKYNSIEQVLTSPNIFSNLEELSLAFESCVFGTDPMILLIAKACKNAINLQTLDIRSYKSPLNSGLNLFDLITTSKMKRLYLCNSNLSEADNLYLSQAIIQRWHKSLVELDLSWSNICNQSLSTILNRFIENSNECQLRSLILTGTCVESNLIRKLVKSVKSLQVLNLTSCRSVERGMKKSLSNQDLRDLF